LRPFSKEDLKVILNSGRFFTVALLSPCIAFGTNCLLERNGTVPPFTYKTLNWFGYNKRSRRRLSLSLLMAGTWMSIVEGFGGTEG
jgi:hypothetical protein